MKKAELQAKLAELKIDFNDKDSVEELKKKLAQHTMPLAKSEPTLPYVLMDAEDDNQILAELGGAIIDHFVYSFKQDGKEVTSLSKTGVDAVCVEMANTKNIIYDVVDTQFREDADYFYVDVKVERSRLLFSESGEYKGKAPMGSATGHKRQAKQQRTKFGLKDDQFAYEKAFSKAERNAKMSLIPKPFVLEMIKQFRGEGKVKQIEMRTKVGENHLRLIHGIGAESGMSHEKIKDLVKQKFGYDSLNELEVADLQELTQLIKGQAQETKDLRLPFVLLGEFNARNFMKAKQDAWWKRALEVSQNDPEKATKLVLDQLKGLDEGGDTNA